jgi:hypothetical protein
MFGSKSLRGPIGPLRYAAARSMRKNVVAFDANEDGFALDLFIPSAGTFAILVAFAICPASTK